MRPTEDATWAVQQEGILFAIDSVPQAMEVALSWEGSPDARLMIMLHSHKAHGTNAYVEHVTEMSSENPQCLRVPAADLAEGEWQVMVHSDGARQVPFTLTMGLVGATGHVVEDDLHGHWLQDGSFEVDVHEIEPCAFLPASAA